MTGELILLVDDEPNIIELAQLYLEREGYRIITASDGREALEAVEKQRPALMVLDLMMPEVDGLEVCRSLRGKKDPVAILMLTARDEDIDKILGLELGADDYLTKPFNPRGLFWKYPHCGCAYWPAPEKTVRIQCKNRNSHQDRI